VKFKKAVESTPEAKDAYNPGLQALRNVDKQRVKAQETKRLVGSVDLDATVKDKYPNDPRWDYAIGHKPSNLKAEMIYWIEIHPASDGEKRVVLAKLNWLKKWLMESAAKLNVMRREFIWVSSGKTSFTLTSPQQKRFALRGLQYKGRGFNITDNAGI